MPADSLGHMLKIILTTFGLTLTLTSCLSDAMSEGFDFVIKEISNSKHDKKVIFFLREAGATVPVSYQVSLIDAKDKFDSTSVGNTFTFDTDNNKTKLEDSSINFRWRTSDTLQINYDSKLRIFIQNRKVQGVTIIYQAW